MDIEKVTTAFSELLTIRVVKGMLLSQANNLHELGIGFTRFDYKPASPEMKAQLAKNLENFICEAIKEKDILTFAYEYGSVRPIGTIDQNMTDELATVLQSLPELPVAECYSFPCETIMRVCVTARNTDGWETKFGFSENILEKLK